MCFHDDALTVTGLNYSFIYNLTEVFPYTGGGTRTDIFSSSIGFNLTRVTLAGKGISSPLEGTVGLDAFLSPGEFFLMSDCCCPCNWTFIPKFATQTGAATQTRDVTFPTHPPADLSGTVTFDANVSFGLIPNLIIYPGICGNNQTFIPQSIYWPTFDGVTPSDPVVFEGNGAGWTVTNYTGSPALDPGVGSIYDGGSIVSPYDTTAGYFFWYSNVSGLPPIPIPGVTGSGNGFRDPCNTAMNFNQSVSWSMTGINGSGSTVNGTGSASIAIAFT